MNEFESDLFNESFVHKSSLIESFMSWADVVLMLVSSTIIVEKLII